MPRFNTQGKNAESTVKFFNFYQELNAIYSYIFAVSTFKLPASTVCCNSSETVGLTAIEKLIKEQFCLVINFSLSHKWISHTYIYSVQVCTDTLVLIRNKKKGERNESRRNKSRKSFRMCDFIHSNYYISHKSLLSIPSKSYAKSSHPVNSSCYLH